jgi:flagella basal body P-ring formation protein FlgA
MALVVTVGCVNNRPALAACISGLLCAATPVCAQVTADAVAQAVALASQAAAALAPPGARIHAVAGALDARLQLAPCARIESHLLAGVPAWGATRVGLRCTQGTAAWKVSLPVTVQVWAPAAVARAALPVGARVDLSQLTLAEVDWAATTALPYASTQPLASRVLARPLAAGQPLRRGDLQPQVWFALGETVRIVATGAGFSISAEGQALTPGLEGQPARVRTEGGRVLVGRPVADRRVEVNL